MRKRIFWLLTLLTVMTLLLAGCGPQDAPSNTAENNAADNAADDTANNAADDTADTTDEEMEDAETEGFEEESGTDGDVVEIRWFVGLGTGTQPEQQEAQEAVVARFNEEHDDIELILEIVPEDQAYDNLQTQIATGNPPDIVGPVGVRGLNGFRQAILDMTPFIEAAGFDMNAYEQELVEFWYQDDKQVGIPFAVFPSYISYNRDLFDEAGLPYPPTEWGGDYEGQPWNFDTLRELAMQLTVDAEGNDATMPEFDPENIVQFGFLPQWTTDPRAVANMFGAASPVSDSGEATIPANWIDAWEWYYNGMWVDYFIPNGPYVNSDLFPGGNAFASGNLAIARTHLWYTCCYGEVNFGVAAMPANADGEITANLHADTFVLMDGGNADVAFEVLTWLLTEAEQDLLAVYGGLPARIDSRETFLANLEEQYPGVDWDVALQGLNYPDNPNHESDMPDFNRAQTVFATFENTLQNEPNLDVEAEAAEVQSELQTIFSNAR